MRSISVIPALLLALALQAQAVVRWNYAFEPEVRDHRMVMHIRLDYAGSPIETERLVLPSAFGYATGLEKGIQNLRNTYQGGRVRISYDLVRDWDVAPERADHHALLEPEYFEFTTQNALVHPPIEWSTNVDVRFDWRKLPAQWSLATSFGAGEHVHRFRGPWAAVKNALFAGGDFRIYKRSIAGRPVTLAIRSKWRFTDEDAVDRIVKMLSFQRAFWNDYDFPYYLVTISNYARDSGSSGGGGFTNALALFLAPSSTFGYGIQSLLAHEVFHTWNPYRMGTVPDASIVMSWFTEGFTSYYQDIMLLRAGLMSFADYVEHTNARLRGYALSPVRNISNKEVIERHRSDSATGELPYTRGAITALWLDHKIRESTDGKASLDTLMFDLVREGRMSYPALTADRVFRTARKYIDEEALQQLQSYVESGPTIPVPPGGLGTCATLQMVEIPAFELGIDREALLTKHIVSGVQPGSAAFNAGLREGQPVTGTSVYWNDVSKLVKLTVKTESGSKQIEYYPRGSSIGIVPQFHVESRCEKQESK